MTEALRDFAVARYQRPGVAEYCLHLQDSTGADINLLLTAAWLAEQGHYWRHAQVRELIACCKEWRERCVLPLRAVRQYLKNQPLYEPTKALEIHAEMHQLHLLHTALQTMAFETFKTHEATPTDVLATNLQVYFNCLTSDQPAVADKDRLKLIEALCR